MDFTIVLLIAFVTGVVLGFLFQKGQFCMTLMLTESVFFKSHKRIAGFVGAILVSVVLFNFATFLGVNDNFNLLRQVGVNPKFFQAPLAIDRSLIGGLIFGFGMILAGGCVAGVLFRIGEGQLSSVIAFFGIMAGFATAIALEIVGVIGLEASLYPPGVLLSHILQVPFIPLVTLTAVFLLALLLALLRNARSRVFLAILLVFFLAIVLLYYSELQSIQSIAPLVELNEKQVEIDRFISSFHVAVSNRSTAKIVPFFTDDALMVLQDGRLIRNVTMIKSYYEKEFVLYHQYIIYGKVSSIQVADNKATAVYNSGLRSWSLGATQPPYIPYRETFTLIRIADAWKIESLVLNARGSE